jgi:PRTRC genetic system ThiF family protein
MSGVFDPNLYIKSVTIVGIGGTGAQVARTIGRIVYDMQRSRKHSPQIVLIDPDTVEEKNVGRQLFSPSMLGKNKAESVGKMLNLALGLNVRWIPDAVDPVRHFERYGSNLVISCVDNHEARKAIHQINGVILGAGNHENSGQVCIGNCDDPEQMRRNLDGCDGKYAYLPKEGLLFPELLQPEPISERPTPVANISCAELVMEGSQHLLINDWMASIVGSYIYKLLHRQPITSFLTFINADNLVVQSKPICREELKVYLLSMV